MPSRPTSVASSSRSHHAHPKSSQLLQSVPLAASIKHNDPLIHLTRAEAALQVTIQSLLDAQSEGLIAGLGPEDHTPLLTSAGTTPTQSIYVSQHEARSKTLQVRQPPRQKITLSKARQGLWKSMQDFAALKEEEGNVLSAEALRREGALHTAEILASKKSGLEQEIEKIQSEDESQRVAGLHSSAQAVEAEIHELENKLYELRAKHRQLVSEAKQLENTVKAKLSSYQGSLQMVEKQIQRFLKSPPVEEPLPFTVTAEGSNGTHSGSVIPFHNLNPSRRTLPLATETWSEESALLAERRDAVLRERDALLQGSEIWSSVVNDIQMSEKKLRAQMQELQQYGDNTSPATRSNGSEETAQDKRNEGIHSLIQDMDRTISSLESKFTEAEEQNWNLLICCIGAELEAFRQGRAILAEALGIVMPDANLQPQHDEGNDLVSVADSADDSVGSTASTREMSALEQSRHGLAYHDDDDDDDGDEEQKPDGVTEDEREAVANNTSHSTEPPSSPPPDAATAMTTAEETPNPPSLIRGGHFTESSEDDEPGPDFLVSHESIG